MRRLFIFIAMICSITAFLFTAYGYYILVRSPGSELGIIEFIVKALNKILRILIHP